MTPFSPDETYNIIQAGIHEKVISLSEAIKLLTHKPTNMKTKKVVNKTPAKKKQITKEEKWLNDLVRPKKGKKTQVISIPKKGITIDAKSPFAKAFVGHPHVKQLGMVGPGGIEKAKKSPAPAIKSSVVSSHFTTPPSITIYRTIPSQFGKIELITSKKLKQHYWHIRGLNGQIVAGSEELYHNKKDLLHSLKLVQAVMGGVKV